MPPGAAGFYLLPSSLRKARSSFCPPRPLAGMFSRVCSVRMAVRVLAPMSPSGWPMSWPRASSRVCSSRFSARDRPGSSVGQGVAKPTLSWLLVIRLERWAMASA